jgi:hypothetical protein
VRIRKEFWIGEKGDFQVSGRKLEDIEFVSELKLVPQENYQRTKWSGKMMCGLLEYINSTGKALPKFQIFYRELIFTQ